MKKVSLFILFVMLCSMVVNAQTKVGDKIGGGVVISVSADGKTVVIAETKDQGACTWDGANALIANEGNHSAQGKQYKNWRLPTKEELALMYTLRSVIGGFSGNYWSVTVGKGQLATLDFSTGKINILPKSSNCKVRAVRNL
jgi:hypothetical protein